MELLNYKICKELGKSYINDIKKGIRNLSYKTILPMALASTMALYACGGSGKNNNQTQCSGSNCTTVVYQCNDNKDNDSDGLADMLDPGCSSTSDNDEYNAPVNQSPVITSTPSLEILVHNGYVYDSANKAWKYDFAKYQYDVNAADAENDLITYYLTQAPIGMTIDAVTGLIEFPLSFNELGKHNVTVAADDGNSQRLQNFILDVRYPYVDEFGNTVANYDFVSGNSEMVLICESPCSSGFDYPANFGGNTITSDEDYFNKKWQGINSGLGALAAFLGVTPEDSLKPVEIHLGGDNRCNAFYDNISGYATKIRRDEYNAAPMQGLICTRYTGQTNLDPASLADQQVMIHEQTHINQNYREPFISFENFKESQAYAVAAVVTGSNGVTSYCNSNLNYSYPYSDYNIYYELCIECGYDADEEPLFWQNVALNPATTVSKVVDIFTNITSCTSGGIENIFINNKLYQCSDGKDNDFDGLIDLNDPNCINITDEAEFY